MSNIIVIIGGPTASYKSEFALRLAANLNGAIINADSMQIYKELPILSAQPTNAERKASPHYLYSFIGANTNYSVADWLNDCSKIIGSLHKENKIPIIVGGTGLYINALVKGLALIPSIDADVKKYCQEQLDQYGYDKVYNFLVSIDPIMLAKIHSNDKQRILRAFEVYTQTKISIFEHHKQTSSPFNIDQFRYVVSSLDREELYSRCDQRIKYMIKNGAIEEAKIFLADNKDHNLQAFNTIGVKPLMNYFEGVLSLDEAVKIWQQETRNFAKRQTTWFKNQLKELNHNNYTTYYDLDVVYKNLYKSMISA